MTLSELLNVVYSDQGVWLLSLPEYDEYFYKDANKIPQSDLNRQVVSVEAYKVGQFYVKAKKTQGRDSKKPKFKDSEEIARQLFVSLIKYGDNAYDGYAILKDGNFVKRIYAESDKEAIKQFNEYLRSKKR